MFLPCIMRHGHSSGVRCKIKTLFFLCGSRCYVGEPCRPHLVLCPAVAFAGGGSVGAAAARGSAGLAGAAA